jgi:hypothetical protein
MKAQDNKAELSGRREGLGFKRRNPKERNPEEKVIYNHYRLSEECKHFTSYPRAYIDFRRGFLAALGHMGQPQRRRHHGEVQDRV